MNTLMPSILEDLARLEVPVEQTNAALTAWNRRQMDLPKTHCHPGRMPVPVGDA